MTETTGLFSDGVTDLRFLSWDKHPTKTPGTQGVYLKATDDSKASRVYYKLSFGDTQGIYGHEAVNEVFISRLLEELGLPHLHYDGCIAKITLDDKEHIEYVCCSEDFKKPSESKMAFEQYYGAQKLKVGADDPLQFMQLIGMGEVADLIFLVDFLIANRDRHGANIEVLCDNISGSVRIAPLFDNGFSLLAPCQNNEDRVALYDPMKDHEVQSFIGTRSLYRNLSLIKSAVTVSGLTKSKVMHILEDLDLPLGSVHMSDEHCRKMVETVWGRYCYARENGFLCEG